MRVTLPSEPFHRDGLSTLWIARTSASVPKGQMIGAAGLFLLAAAATASIAVRDPLVAWSYCLGIFLLAGYWAVDIALRSRPFALTLPGVCLGLISVWGFVQLAAGATVYRYATWDAALRTAALGATAFAASQALAHPRLRWQFLAGFAWFGAAVSLLAVAAYFTSPGQVFWFFPSPYPDVWGPFFSRNETFRAAYLFDRPERGGPQSVDRGGREKAQRRGAGGDRRAQQTGRGILRRQYGGLVLRLAPKGAGVSESAPNRRRSQPDGRGSRS